MLLFSVLDSVNAILDSVLLYVVVRSVPKDSKRAGAPRMASAGARRRGPEKNPGARRRTVARTVQDRAGAENSSGRSDSRKREMVQHRACSTRLPPSLSLPSPPQVHHGPSQHPRW